LPSAFINTSRHTHSNAQLKGRAMQIHAIHYEAPPSWFACHNRTQQLRFDQSSDYLFSHHKVSKTLFVNSTCPFPCG
jgi:hypothetical protein